jgi:hypothetical protein
VPKCGQLHDVHAAWLHIDFKLERIAWTEEQRFDTDMTRDKEVKRPRGPGFETIKVEQAENGSAAT